jgi:hypothetical protein
MTVVMRVEILHVPDCPNVALLEQRLCQACPGDPAGLAVMYRVVRDVEIAVAVGMAGSPTLLVDGVDPFAGPGLAPSVSCRLYPDEDGGMAGAPSVGALRRALRGDHQPDEIDDESGECCVFSGDAAATLRTVRRRTAPTDPVERAVHQTILRVFAAAGRPPHRTELELPAAPAAAEQVLGRLHEADGIRLDPDGHIRVAYPFSAVPTRHRVRLATGVEVYAMCAIDALGMPAMLGVDAVIPPPTRSRHSRSP